MSLLLPQLESFGEIKGTQTKRLLTIVNHLSFHQPELVPGFDKKVKKPSLLNSLKENKNNLKLFSGFDNPGIQLGLGHTPSVGILSGYFNKLERKNRISVDQQVAEYIGQDTRFKSLAFQAGYNLNFSQVCWDKHGLPVHQLDSAKKIFHLLFGIENDKKEQQKNLTEDKSILDLVFKQAKSMNKNLNQRDRHKIDEYFTSIREVEEKVKRQTYWSKKDKPKMDYTVPQYSSHSVEEFFQVMLDLAVLAFETDSTRTLTIQIPFWEGFKQPNINGNYHDFSHHGKKPEKIKKLLVMENMVLNKIDQTMTKLKQTSSATGNLFDETKTLVTAAMGNANAHTFNDLPALYYSNDIKSFSHERHEKKPICNLYKSIIQDFSGRNQKFGESNNSVELV